MMRKTIAFVTVAALVLWAGTALAAAKSHKKGLLVHCSIYGSTLESAYWVKSIIGLDNHLDVKALPQVITVKPYDYVIIGSVTRNEDAVEPVYEFVEKFKDDLAQKEVCYFLNCGDSDETMVLKAPGMDAHLIAGRNYLMPIMNAFPEIKPVVIGGFGGRQVMPNMKTKDSFFIWLVGKLAKEGAAWEGLDIWESLVPERVEAFANEVRVKVLGIDPLTGDELTRHRGYWESLQPASLTDPSKKKFKPKPWVDDISTEKIRYVRFRINGNLADGVARVKQWAQQEGMELQEQVVNPYNVYYHALKDGLTTHVVTATLPEDPGRVHFSFRCWDKPDARGVHDAAIANAAKVIITADRKVD